MNRQFKFRVWDKKAASFISCSPMGLNMHGELTNVYDGLSLDPMANFIIQQYTGLKDKNGKEIYEGDILERILVSGIISRNDVYWDFGAWQLYRQGVPSELYEASYDRMTVIGNIFENPELLKNE